MFFRIVKRLLLQMIICLLMLPTFMVMSADVDIEGVESSEVLENIEVHILALATPTSTAEIDAYQQQVTKKVQQAAQVFGYYAVQLTVIPPADDELADDWLLQIDIGPVTKIRQLSIQVTGDAADDKRMQSLLSALPLKENDPLNHTAYESSKSQLQSLAMSLGFFDFEFTQSDIKVYQSKNAADITLHIDSGTRYRFGELVFGQDLRAESMAKKLLPFKTGDFYQASQLGLFNQLLKQTQYFRHVIVRPLVDEAQNYQVPVEVILSHKPRDNFDVGIGVSSDEGPRFTGKWRRPWVNSHGHSVGGEVFVSAPEQYVSLDYRIPLEDPIQNYASFQLGYQAENNNDTRSDKLSLSATRHWVLPDSDWHRSAFIRVEKETFVQGLEPEQTTRLVLPGFTLSRLRSKGGLDVYWGDRQSITTEVASDSLLSDINLFRVTAQSKWLRSVDQHRFLMRVKLGGIATGNFEQVPSSLRYFAGGDQSVRGFGYETLSPFELDSEGKRKLTGGQYLAVASIEYSYPVAEKWRAAVFVDAGNASENIAQDIATGVGVGASWLSPVGPVRIYVAKGKSDTESNWRIHFSMGPAL